MRNGRVQASPLDVNKCARATGIVSASLQVANVTYQVQAQAFEFGPLGALYPAYFAIVVRTPRDSEGSTRTP